MELVLIAAVARQGAIGQGGTMPWRLPADLQHFKRTTLGAPVIMGRKTWESLPAAFKPLPGRRNLVVTRNATWGAEGAQAVPSLDAAFTRLAGAERVFVIGGGELYAQALPRADALVLTEIDADFPQADTFFPPWDRGAFDEVARESHEGDAGLRYAFVTYRRRRPAAGPSTSNPLAGDLFRHVSAEKSALYRSIMEVFAAAKRQYRLQLRPDEVLAEADWPDAPPRIEEVNNALAQLEAWGNLESQTDMARVSSLSDYYRARFLYRLSQGGEAVETALIVFLQTLERRAELQTVALEDIASQLQALRALADEAEPDVAKIHETLRDLVRVFEGLADNAQAFMAGVARSIELQQAEAGAVVSYKRRLIDYLERFMGDLVRRSDMIARLLLALGPRIDALLWQVAEREARDAAPGDAQDQADARSRHWRAWRERWNGLRGWFLRDGHESQAEQLRARARSAIPQLLGAIAALNERRSGRSDRSADFRMLAGWFASCGDDGEAHRLARAAFALNPARHFSLNAAAGQDLPASTRWADAPPLLIHPRLREYGEATPRGPLPRVRDRAEERAFLARQLAEESMQADAARKRLATGRPTRLSELGELDVHAFGLFLGLLGEALTEQVGPEATVQRQTGDGLLLIRLAPLAAGSVASITTRHGVFAGRDHVITITPTQEAG